MCRRSSRFLSALLASCALGAVASGQTVGGWGVGDEDARPGERPISRDVEVVTFAGGVLTGIQTGRPWSTRTIATLPESEGVVRSFGGRLYVLTPESGMIRSFDRAGNLVGQAAVDPASAPTDIAPVSPEEVYVATARDGRVTRVSLGDGIARSFVDLNELDEPDGTPDPGMMIVDRGRLFVQLRRIDDKNPWMFDERGALAVIDLASETLIDADAQTPGVQAIELAGPHPRLKMRILEGPRRLYISSSGADPYTVWPPGGMDEVDLDTLTPLGLVFSEIDAANISAIWPITTTSGILIFHTDIIASAHLSSYSVAPFMFDGIHDELFGYIQVLAVDDRTGLIYMPTLAGQVRVIDAASERTLAIPEIGGGVATDIEIVRWSRE